MVLIGGPEVERGKGRNRVFKVKRVAFFLGVCGSSRPSTFVNEAQKIWQLKNRKIQNVLMAFSIAWRDKKRKRGKALGN